MSSEIHSTISLIMSCELLIISPSERLMAVMDDTGTQLQHYKLTKANRPASVLKELLVWVEISGLHK